MLSYYLVTTGGQDQNQRFPVIADAKKNGDGKLGVGLFFLDSGAHSLYNVNIFDKPEVMAKPIHRRYDYYDTPAFWDYVDAYAGFVKEHKDVIDYYANVDVIYNPEKSWKVQKYLEDKHGLSPVPVLHWGADLKWFKRHLDAGYEFLGIGGLGQGATQGSYKRWADGVFNFLCPPPKRLPLVRTHGFAMTAYNLLIRYPWWSVDSATWTKMGAFGNILVPHRRGNEFTFGEPPYIVTVSEDSPAAKKFGKHYRTLSKLERDIVDCWLDQIGVPLGSTGVDGEPIEYGVSNRHSERKIANLLFFEGLRAWLPEYPWPFGGYVDRGFGLC